MLASGTADFTASISLRDGLTDACACASVLSASWIKASQLLSVARLAPSRRRGKGRVVLSSRDWEKKLLGNILCFSWVVY